MCLHVAKMPRQLRSSEKWFKGGATIKPMVAIVTVAQLPGTNLKNTAFH